MIDRGLIDGHAYSTKELSEIRRILGTSKNKWPDRRLHRHTDELVLLIGFFIKNERRMPSHLRQREIKKRLISPSQKILEALQSDDFEKEFRQVWGSLRKVDTVKLEKILRKTVAAAEKHVELLKVGSQKGQLWDSQLKYRFLDLVAMLCEYINHDFEPTRNVQAGQEESSKFGHIVSILGIPLFPPSKDLKFPIFIGAQRKHIDNWNKQIKSVFKMSLHKL